MLACGQPFLNTIWHYSTVSSKPVTWNFMTFEHLLSELLIATILDCVEFQSVRVCVDIMILSEEVTNRVECSNQKSNHAQNQLCVRDFTSSQVHQILRNIMGH